MSAAAELDALLRTAVAEGVTPGCAAAVWREGELRLRSFVGCLDGAPESAPVTADTAYDLASLTKILSTTTLTAQAIDAGALRLDDRLPEALAVVGGFRPQLRDLLEHAAGLEAHREFFAPPWSLGPGQREAFLDAVRGVAPACPPRARAIYTDLGFALLGAWLERALGARLDALFAERIAEPLGLAGQIGFRPLDRSYDDALTFPVTEAYDRGEPQTWWPIRARVGQAAARGVVHDDNCVVMHGVAGHAGLFGTLDAVLAVARAWLEARLPGVDPQRCPALVERFFTPSTVPGSTRRLGFDGVSTDPSGTPSGGSTGGVLSPASVGHLGFTGTSVWIDPPARSIYVLLANRVHPSRADTRIRALRPAFHRLAAKL
ncbi:D-alanyl-D-alanine carboxypeptidease, putative [Plesiocystis pacifica SIR-1]|uniref:D-alanyl-D-alanine carboxypeptidease, putative n=1 Tax=Plesiocystis pacifica SIR-1 TaxID=391625 RepID=A6FYW5_9BACT|nr:serine hydrolase domain-containing protein [Plesiocystis pacifica]EDM81120.1 D-alanyl-D-alanine carboxypeptidease, putative [Plesiocystis pacifica SIR-1]